VARFATPQDAVLRGPSLLDAHGLRRLAAGSGAEVLAAVRFATSADPPELPWLTAKIPSAPLVDGAAVEIWPAASPVRRLDSSGIAAATDGASLFASMVVENVDGDTLEGATFDAYDRLLVAARRAGYPYLLRVWNFVPGINDGPGDFERYKLFCKGRSNAFVTHAGDAFPQILPAASAVGCTGNALLIHALAAKQPGLPVENPRQVSAYRYPERYGPRSPTFARGMKAPPPWRGALFVSGTASITGHESLHPGDPAAQAGETLTNIDAVLDAAGIAGKGAPLGERIDALRVYVRHRRHLPALREALDRRLGRAVPTVWLQAEICRAELLVEIEATVLAPTT
jgi:chorismate lyase/3-hydroxybenzoate synthase